MSNSNIKMSENNSLIIQIVADNITRLMNERKIDTHELSQLTGLGTATINSLKRGVGNPTLTTLELLAKVFNVTVGEMTEKREKGALARVSVAPMPLIKLSDVDEFIENGLFAETFIAEVDSPIHSSLFAIKIDNDTLYPHIPSGTVCIISKDEKFKDGDIVLVKINNHSPFFRKIYIEEQYLAFSPVTLESTPSVYENYELLGVVIKKIRSF
ncbi:helix-turn-helix domain-containing protein (plasmid) [Arsenophonus sp. aPb]|uniref:helix-turn-helix domain-containing protein n=1 Tax=Arsenophonus sp. aPb TaxID=3041619 RepID=UPI0024682CC5|nr:helix-turn-helix domain-containing protein [Arsenophonus sp. aPb]WGL99815.1 helix-turn-helix domain-containing protein [Arsenophonus sp. aPb]